jgi:calcium/calmodulin-dependent protein kinase I
MAQIFIAVDYANSQGGIIHRDIKPDNILLEYPNSIESLKLADFGLSTTKNSCGMPKTIKGGAGTPIYFAPCMLQGLEYGTRVDTWACGVVMWNL